MQEEIWQAIVNCDDSYDGKLFYGVVTTGIFCRPSCKSRTPKQENVKLFTSMTEALSANFRACKRCKPDQLKGPDEELAQKVKGLIEARYAEPLTLSIIASELHLSPFHLHRLFKRTTDLTPADYLLMTRLTAAKQLLSESELSVTEIALTSGFNNTAYFSTVFQKHVGMSPSQFRHREPI